MKNIDRFILYYLYRRLRTDLMNRYLSCLRLNAVLFCKIFTCGFLGQKDYAEGYDNVAENYDDNWLCHIKPCTQNFLDRLPPLQSDKPIVDLGCGTGFSTEWLTKRYDNPVTGVDISAGMLKQAAKKCRKHNLFMPTCWIICGNFRQKAGR